MILFGAMTIERFAGLLLSPHLALLLPTIFVGVPAMFLRSTRGQAQKVLAVTYRDLKIYAAPETGLIPFSFQHYSGFFVYHLETTLQGYATPDDALQVGKRILFHNWTSGLCAFAGLLGAIASTSQYLQVKRAAKTALAQPSSQKIRQTPLELPTKDVPSKGWQRFGTVVRITGIVLLGLLALSAILQYSLLPANEINGWMMIISLFVSIALVAISGFWR